MKIFLKNKESETCYSFSKNCVDSFKPKLKVPPILKEGTKGNLLSQTSVLASMALGLIFPGYMYLLTLSFG